MWERASIERRDADAVMRERLAYLEERADDGKLSDDAWKSLRILRRRLGSR